MAHAGHGAGPRRGRPDVSDTPGVTSLIPPDAVARMAAALGGQPWTGRHVARGDLPPFTGRPSGTFDTELQPPLDQLADVQEAPTPAEPTLGEMVAGHAARLAAVEALAHSHDEEEGPWND